MFRLGPAVSPRASDERLSHPEGHDLWLKLGRIRRLANRPETCARYRLSASVPMPVRETRPLRDAKALVGLERPARARDRPEEPV
jgi:hypothetical protein